jgi:hypothetical protein
VSFSHVGQCDETDCAAQAAAFGVPEDGAGRAPAGAPGGHRVALDVDGNGMSGRFVGLLGTGSAVARVAGVREWWWGGALREWVHFAPMSVAGGPRGGEWDEVLGYLLQDGGEGESAAREMGERAKGWVGEGMREVDVRVWVWRLMLEWARLLDDRREEIGFNG